MGEESHAQSRSPFSLGAKSGGIETVDAEENASAEDIAL